MVRASSTRKGKAQNRIPGRCPGVASRRAISHSMQRCELEGPGDPRMVGAGARSKGKTGNGVGPCQSRAEFGFKEERFSRPSMAEAFPRAARRMLGFMDSILAGAGEGEAAPATLQDPCGEW